MRIIVTGISPNIQNHNQNIYTSHFNSFQFLYKIARIKMGFYYQKPIYKNHLAKILEYPFSYNPFYIYIQLRI
jgi:hypothetical protein